MIVSLVLLTLREMRDHRSMFSASHETENVRVINLDNMEMRTRVQHNRLHIAVLRAYIQGNLRTDTLQLHLICRKCHHKPSPKHCIDVL